MLKKLKLATKMFGGFLVMLVILAVVAQVGYKGLTDTVERVEKGDDANRMVKMILQARRHEKNFIIRKDPSYIAMVDDLIETLIAQANATGNKLDRNEGKGRMDMIIEAVRAYRDSFHKFLEMDKKKDEIMTTMGEQAQKAMERLNRICVDQQTQLKMISKTEGGLWEDKLNKLEDANRLIQWFLEARKNEKEFILQNGQKEWRDRHGELMDRCFRLANDLTDRFKNEMNQRQIDSVKTALASYQTAFGQFISTMEEQKKADGEMVTAARETQKICEDMRAEQKAMMEKQILTAKTISLIFTGTGIVIGLLLAWLITRGITRPINRIIEGLALGADQISSASGQVSSASQSLAQGASEQAAAIEETSASMEQMSSMTRQNAGHASLVNNLMTEAKSVVDKAGLSMSQMNDSMSEIASAGQEIGKIIKTIDEIAFQTNLLALNAAVEAARAGEAGAGFAVVAEEVRNLAQRAGEAANNTGNLIVKTISSINQGAELVRTTHGTFSEVAASSHKVAELVGNISAASTDQAQGIDQINQAVSQMDQVTQQNAANAEQSASAAEELNSQAESMLDVVDELLALVDGATAVKRRSRVDHFENRTGPRALLFR